MSITEYNEKKCLDNLTKEAHENSYKNGFGQGAKEGLERGRKKGCKTGRRESLGKIAKRMRCVGYPVSLIEKLTGLTSDELSEL